ncbi:hypothetical protein LRS71_17775 [Rhodococcus pyridinivorans]|uniref:hypothetical protein n=1 Tax=Rhodococcus pyridinivorans TaxID=103816 RepID=UPI001E471113|nr:hypothetical protein [Rhodococcus pyridinivorans]MCD5421385.1 hypothetical protein [Rhodococcus pyridinivorans]
MRTCRSHRHQLNGPADFRRDGRCIHCSRATQQRYRARCRDALRTIKAGRDVI